MYAAARAPASLAAPRIAGISLLFRPGIIGAISTITGTPASASPRIALSRAAGVLVREVAPDSPAAAQGIEPGDLITKVIKDRTTHEVTDLESFEQVVGDAGDLAVYVQTPGGPGRFLALKAAEAPEEN